MALTKGESSKNGSISTVNFFKSLYNDPFKWSLVKSITMFGVAVLFAREMAIASTETNV